MSILNDTKKLLGITPDYTQFDKDITIAINSAFSELAQVGVGPETGYSITGSAEDWKDFIPEGGLVLNMVKSFIPLKVRLVFDPPTSSIIQGVIKSEIDELVWRMKVATDV